MTEPSIMSVVHYGFVAALHQEFYQRVEVKMGTIKLELAKYYKDSEMTAFISESMTLFIFHF